MTAALPGPDVLLELGELVARLIRLVVTLVRHFAGSPSSRPPAEPDELLNTRQAAELIHRAPETVRDWVRQGRLRDVGEGRPLYRRADVLAAAAFRRRPAGDETPQARARAILQRLR